MTGKNAHIIMLKWNKLAQGPNQVQHIKDLYGGILSKIIEYELDKYRQSMAWMGNDISHSNRLTRGDQIINSVQHS